MRTNAFRFSVVLLGLPLLAADAQDLEVPGNLMMVNSTETAGNIVKNGVPFIHNFGFRNTFLGTNAGNLTMTGGLNTANGDLALSSNTSGYENTAAGVNALRGNTTGGANTATGFSALQNNTVGGSNTATGEAAMLVNTTGSGNTATGVFALGNNFAGDFNTATGLGALYGNTTGNENTALGVDALGGNSIGNKNTAVGTEAMLASFTGSFNTGMGYRALHLNWIGSNNTAIGPYALSGNMTGSNNTAIGYTANVSTDHLNNATAVGAGAIVDASNKIRLGNDAVTVIEGQVGFTASSDRNKKENFQPVDGEEVLTKIGGLTLKSWNFIGQDPKQFRHYGPAAQDFFAAFGHDAIGIIGTPITITSTDMEGILMVAAQALEKRTIEQKEEIEALKARLEALEHKIGHCANPEAR